MRAASANAPSGRDETQKPFSEERESGAPRAESARTVQSYAPKASCEDASLAYDPGEGVFVAIDQVDALTREGIDPLQPLSDDAAMRRGLGLCPWRGKDFPAFYKLLSDPRVWRFLPETFPAPFDTEQAEALFKLALTLENHLVRAVWLDGAIVGQVRLDFSIATRPQREIAELSYWLGAEFWGKGIGSALVAAVPVRAFGRMPALLRLIAKVHPNNLASARVLAKAGFQEIAPPQFPAAAPFTRWRWFQLRRQDLG